MVMLYSLFTVFKAHWYYYQCCFGTDIYVCVDASSQKQRNTCYKSSKVSSEKQMPDWWVDSTLYVLLS